jgi:hypothetical protein
MQWRPSGLKFGQQDFNSQIKPMKPTFAVVNGGKEGG